MNANARTLYLYSGNDTRVLRDGHCLRVRQQSRADRYYAIHRIANIVSGTKVQWDSDALMLCAENRIDIHFVSRRHQIIACFNAPCQPTLENLQQQINRYSALPGSKQHFERWLAVQHHMITAIIAEELNVGHRRLLSHGLNAVIETRLNGYVPHKQYRLYCQHVIALHQITFGRYLKAHAVDSRHIAFALIGHSIEKAMAKLCTLRFLPVMLGDLRRHARSLRKHGRFNPCQLQLRAIKLFEKHKTHQLEWLDYYCRQFILHVYETLREHDHA